MLRHPGKEDPLRVRTASKLEAETDLCRGSAGAENLLLLPGKSRRGASRAPALQTPLVVPVWEAPSAFLSPPGRCDRPVPAPRGSAVRSPLLESCVGAHPAPQDAKDARNARLQGRCKGTSVVFPGIRG